MKAISNELPGAVSNYETPQATINLLAPVQVVCTSPTSTEEITEEMYLFDWEY